MRRSGWDVSMRLLFLYYLSRVGTQSSFPIPIPIPILNHNITPTMIPIIIHTGDKTCINADYTRQGRGRGESHTDVKYVNNPTMIRSQNGKLVDDGLVHEFFISRNRLIDPHPSPSILSSREDGFNVCVLSMRLNRYRRILSLYIELKTK